ncbi:MAG TPA: protein kinase [Micromonosporaceae bacterium]|nr:protein kinase [Micromonosporaceae bacterium]
MSRQLLGDRYRLEEVLGSGGMATVWRGWDLRLERAVAVKTLDHAGLSDPSVAERFDREARTVARLTHPNIVAVYDVGTQDGVGYLVMELIGGVSVATLLDSGPLSVQQAVAIAAQTCDALGAAHSAGVIHRDVKPANIMVTHAGAVKVCDFGIARQLHAAGLTLTAPDSAIGTSDFMAPEQATGDPVDARTDLYALGCVLYAMLTGRPPFTGDNPVGIIYQHLHNAPTPVRTLRADVPAELAALIGQLLAKDPAERPADHRQVLAALGVVDGQSPTARPAEPTTAVRPTGSATAVRPVARAAVPTPTRTMPAAMGHDERQLGGWPDRHRRIAPGSVALVAITVVALVTAAVLAAALLSRPTGQPQAAPPPSTGTPTVSAAPPSPSNTPTPGDPTDQIAALQATLQQQVEAGHVDPHAADDLSQRIDDLTHRLDHGHGHDIADKIKGLRDDLSQLQDDGKVTTGGYDALSAGLDQLAASLTTGNAGDNGN